MDYNCGVLYMPDRWRTWPWAANKGEMMKNVTASTCFCRVILGIILCALVLSLSGCGHVVKVGKFVDETVVGILTLGSEPEMYEQPGETAAEGKRRHLRNERIDQGGLMADIDKFFLTDKPSKLSDKRIP